jgi:NitT/TauT family transport system ATP-binding protein
VAGFAPPSSAASPPTASGDRPGPERGMVFQEYALFPWMTVADNIAFGLQIKGQPKARSRPRWISC